MRVLIEARFVHQIQEVRDTDDRQNNSRGERARRRNYLPDRVCNKKQQRTNHQRVGEN